MIATLAFLVGLTAISVGVGMIYLPAGIIAAGVGLVALSFILSRGIAPESHYISAANPLDIKQKKTGGKQ